MLPDLPPPPKKKKNPEDPTEEINTCERSGLLVYDQNPGNLQGGLHTKSNIHYVTSDIHTLRTLAKTNATTEFNRESQPHKKQSRRNNKDDQRVWVLMLIMRYLSKMDNVVRQISDVYKYNTRIRGLPFSLA